MAYSFASPEYRVAENASNPNNWHHLSVSVAELFRDGNYEQIKKGLVCLIHNAYSVTRIGIMDSREHWDKALYEVDKRIKNRYLLRQFLPNATVRSKIDGKGLLNAVIRYIDSERSKRGMSTSVYEEIVNEVVEAILNVVYV